MLIAGEYGKTLRVNADYDLTGASEITLTVYHPTDGTSFSRTLTNGDLTVGNVDAVDVEIDRADGTVVKKTFLAGEYIEYELQQDEIPVKGRYRRQLILDKPGQKHYKSRTDYLTVYD